LVGITISRRSGIIELTEDFPKLFTVTDYFKEINELTILFLCVNHISCIDENSDFAHWFTPLFFNEDLFLKFKDNLD